MGRLTGSLLVLCLMVLGTGARAGSLSESGICARCHETEAGLAADAGGHAPFVDCFSCHDDRRPGHFGHGHRTIPTTCLTHHTVDVDGHPARTPPRKPAALRRNCLSCHDPHGSTNAHLIRTTIRTRGKLRPIDFHDAGGAVPGGFVDPVNPGHGLCEVCHKKTKFYLANGHGDPHFTDDCALCHDHTVAFAPVVTPTNCVVCHADEAAKLAKPGLHNTNFSGNCVTCHAEVNPAPGPGHRAIPACSSCHDPSDASAHAPPETGPMPCTLCHDVHGSDNIELVREVVHTTPGVDRAVAFSNRNGKADGSFVSVSAPGTGVGEPCHTTTNPYRNDGSGSAHYTTPCYPCHTHGRGFAKP